MRQIFLAVLMISAACSAQTGQPPLAGKEYQFLRFVLLNVASLDHDPAAIQKYENSLVKQFGLNAQESQAIHASGQSLRPVLAQLRQSSKAVIGNRTFVSDADTAALASLDAQREQAIGTLANQLLNSVRAETAARLRAPGRILATPVEVLAHPVTKAAGKQ